jgi:putative (di)nucleoside polyphosphate hydrolase
MNATFQPTRPVSDAPGEPIDLNLYRPNVGVVLFNADGRVWLGRRVHTPGPFNWQFPQGGVDKGEDLLQAAKRELHEETGVASTRYLARTEGWITYDFPEGYKGSKTAKGWRGQKQVWFALRFIGAESEINLFGHQQVEFDDWRWAGIDEAPDLVVPFKRPAYEAVVEAFRRWATSAG